MHTSQQISLNDFSIIDKKNNVEIDFNTFCPNYYNRDRIAIINPFCNEALLGASRITFAFTAAFYESLRSAQKPFFNYPQHFTLFVGGKNTVSQKYCKPWTMLDVWPDSQWRHCENNITAILKMLFELQVNRIIWPLGWTPTESLNKLPDSTYKILLNRIDNVYFYGSKTTEFCMSIRGKSYELWSEAISNAPDLSFNERPRDYLNIGSPETLFSICGIKTDPF